MAFSFNGTSQYISANSGIVTAPPMTFAGWFYPNSVDGTGTYAIVAEGQTSTSNGYIVGAAGAVAGDPVRFLSNANNASTTTGFSASVWQHAAGSTATTSSRTAWLNGGGKGTGTNTVTSPTPDRTSIGAWLRSTVATGTYMDGLLAECAIWDVALTDAEIVSLAKGFKPHRIRPQNLKLYVPLIRELRDWRQAVALTNNNTATVANHPRVY